MAKQDKHRVLPPRSAALDNLAFLFSFDVNCGQLLPGHDFVARGLSDGGIGHDLAEDALLVQMFSLEYELVPGIPEAEANNFFGYLVGITYSADVDLPWEPTDGGALAPFRGGPSTHGSRGSWPLPADARRLIFDLFPIVPGERWPQGDSAGQLIVDLKAGTAQWKRS